MCLRIIVEDDSRIKDSLRVDELFNLVHQTISLLSPFQFNERGHVPSGSVLCLEGSVVLVNHQVAYIVHEMSIFAHFFRALEILVEHKVEVSGKCVTEDHGIGVAVFVEQFPEVCNCLCKAGNFKANVFYDGSCPGLSHAGNCRKAFFPDFPESCPFLFIHSK